MNIAGCSFRKGQVFDLLGNGTACLVWSSPLPGTAGPALRYVDLIGGQKPHLLANIKNNLGAETALNYAPSTRFYLADRFAGRPWITRIYFPVHVVDRVETYDHIGRSRFNDMSVAAPQRSVGPAGAAFTITAPPLSSSANGDHYFVIFPYTLA
jgi:hypothetical protein